MKKGSLYLKHQVPTSKGPIVQALSAFPRRSGGRRSDIVPPPRVSGGHPAIPMQSRNMINIGRLVLKAQATHATRNPIFEECMIGDRPKSSLSGDKKSGPMKNPTMYTLMEKAPNESLSEWKSSSIDLTPGATIDDARAL